MRVLEQRSTAKKGSCLQVYLYLLNLTAKRPHKSERHTNQPVDFTLQSSITHELDSKILELLYLGQEHSTHPVRTNHLS